MKYTFIFLIVFIHLHCMGQKNLNIGLSIAPIVTKTVSLGSKGDSSLSFNNGMQYSILCLKETGKNRFGLSLGFSRTILYKPLATSGYIFESDILSGLPAPDLYSKVGISTLALGLEFERKYHTTKKFDFTIDGSIEPLFFVFKKSQTEIKHRDGKVEKLSTPKNTNSFFNINTTIGTGARYNLNKKNSLKLGIFSKLSLNPDPIYLTVSKSNRLCMGIGLMYFRTI